LNTPLKIIVVPSWAMPELERREGFAVILGDCVMPGHILARAETVEEADEKGQWWANHYKLPVYLYDMEAARRKSDIQADAVLGRIIPGGSSKS
jgi:hypothetical protein